MSTASVTELTIAPVSSDSLEVTNVSVLQVKTEYIKRKGVITVDGHESPSVTMVGDAITLDVEGKLYLGGLPSEYRARNIGNVSSSC